MKNVRGELCFTDQRHFFLLEVGHGHSYAVLRGFAPIDMDGEYDEELPVMDLYFAGAQRISCWREVGPIHLRIAATRHQTPHTPAGLVDDSGTASHSPPASAASNDVGKRRGNSRCPPGGCPDVVRKLSRTCGASGAEVYAKMSIDQLSS
jgi:hypothetical protein